MKPLIIANWKLNKTLDEASFWLQEFDQAVDPQILQEKEIVVCPSFVLIPFLRQTTLINPDLRGLKLGAQTVSHFEEGAYTGEVSAKQLRGIVDFCIIGHSERRKYFGETDEQAAKKVELCQKYEITPVVCVSNFEQVEAVKLSSCQAVKLILAYEPPSAISTNNGIPDTPEHTQKMALEIKSILGQNTKVIYGGSVNSKNAKEFLKQPDIEGLLVGNASLNAKEFAEIVNR